MTQKFDDLHAAALARADAELTHIAQTEQLSDEQFARITARALEKAGFPTRTTTAAAAVQPVIRHRKRTKLLGALIAAALSVTVLAVGVGGYLRYNKALLEDRFGVLGTAKLEDLNVPQPVTFTNGTVNATVEAVLSDGNRAMALITYTLADPAQEINWDLQLYQTADPADTGFISAESHVVGDKGKTCLQTLMLNLTPNTVHDAFTLQYAKTETGFPSAEDIKAAKKEGMRAEDLYESPAFVGSHAPYFNELTDGLQITLPLVQNIPVLTLCAENGNTVKLSGYELFSEDENLSAVPWGRETGILKLTRSDGSTAETALLWGHSSRDAEGADYSQIYYAELIDGVKYNSDKPNTYIGFADVMNVTEIEYNGTVYTRVSGADKIMYDEEGNAVPHDNGEYPVNENGQTYGGGMDADYPEDMPDLIAVVGDNGVHGYIYAAETYGDAPRTPAEALRVSGEKKIYNVYLSDGVTVVDTFTED